MNSANSANETSVFSLQRYINHAGCEYVRGEASTTEVERYFALLKRGITGSFDSVSKTHLHRYWDEFTFRWNERKASTASGPSKLCL